MNVVLWLNLACTVGGLALGGIGLYRINRAFKRIRKLEEQ